MTGPAHHLRVEHISRFSYSEPAHGSVMLLRLRPREDLGQKVDAFRIDIEPDAIPSETIDPFGNVCHVFNVHRQHRELTVRTRSLVQTSEHSVATAEQAESVSWSKQENGVDRADQWDFLQLDRYTIREPALRTFMDSVGVRRLATPVASVLEASSLLHETFRYVPGSTTVNSSIREILETGCGVCQDYTHVLIAIARSWGIPSRYVSGYLHLEGFSGEQSSPGGSHAWAECLFPGAGWVGIDPTNDTIADDRHIRLAIGRDYGDAAPTRGTLLGGGQTTLDVEVRVWVDGSDRSATDTFRRQRRAGLPGATAGDQQ